MNEDLAIFWLTIPSYELIVRDPLEFLEVQHRIQLAVCDTLEDIADNPLGEGPRQDALGVKNYLQDHLAAHEMDEDQNLRACVNDLIADPEIDVLFDELARLHRRDHANFDAILDGLTALSVQRPLNDTFRFVINSLQLVRSLREHLQWEEQVIYPLSQHYLTAKAKRTLGKLIVQRRLITA